jgi:hypothetical protein
MKSESKKQLEKDVRAAKAKLIKQLETHLETGTRWEKHMARPSQVRAGAKKLYDVMAGQVRRNSRTKAATA